MATNEYKSDTTRDNEQRKFQADADGNVAVNVKVAKGSAIAYQSFTPVIIPANSTLVIDSTLLADFSRLEYILNFKDDPITVTKSLKLIIQNDAGDLTDTVSERLGGNISVQVDPVDDGINCNVEISNNENYDLTVTFLKAILE